MQTKEQAASPSLLTRKELAERLGVSQGTIGRHDKNGVIKGLRIGGGVRYDWDQVIANLPSTADIRNAR